MDKPTHLRPPWKPGQSGNPLGRQAGVVYPADHLRILVGKPVEELESIRDNQAETVSRRAAARMALQTISGTPSDQRQAFAEVADRTSGKPTQSVNVTTRAGSDPERVLAELRERFPSRSLPNPPDQQKSLP